MTVEEYRALLDTDFINVDIEQLTDIRNIKIDKNLSQEKRQAQFFEAGRKSLSVTKRQHDY